MPAIPLTQQRARWQPVVDAYERHVAAGAEPIGGKMAAPGGKGAIGAAAAELGLNPATARRLLLTGLSCRAAERQLAARGELGGPPIPEIARPPEGMIIARNSGTYDADGRLVRQSVSTKAGPGDVYSVPAGHAIKGESALLDRDGRLLARWIKTKEGAGEGLVKGLRETFAGYSGAAPVLEVPAVSDDDLLTVYPLPDLHLGMYAWGSESGENYDISLATAQAERHMAQLVAQSRPSRRCVVLGLGDYFHANDTKAVTPGSGHQLDVDGRWPKVYAAGARLACAVIDMAARHHELVEVVFLPGNHDPDAAVTLTVALGMFYAAQSRITVYQEPGIAWYRQFGRVLLGATHGHTMKPERMAMMLATDQPEGWGSSDHRHFFYGHIHHESAKDVAGVRVESFSSPAPRDAWNASKGFRSGRAMQAITFHRTGGEVGRHRISITQHRARLRVRAGRVA